MVFIMRKEQVIKFNMVVSDRLFNVTINFKKRRGATYYVDFNNIRVSASTFYNVDLIKSMILSESSKIIKMSDKTYNKVDLNKYDKALHKEEYLIMGELVPVKDEFLAYKDLFKKYKTVLNEIYYDTLDRLSIKGVSLITKPLKSKWGSYNSKKNQITLNLYLLFFEREIIEYVVCHEVCHIGNLTHNKKFHNDLDIICPKNKQLRKKINDLTVLTRKLQLLS